jgi:hypothetical protein
MSNVVIEAPDPTTARDFSRFSCRRFDTVDSRMTSRSGRPCLPALLAVNELAHRPRCEPSPINLQGVIYPSPASIGTSLQRGPLTGRCRSEIKGPGGGFRSLAGAV